MEELLDDLERTAQRCDRAAEVFTSEPIASVLQRLHRAITSVGNAWSQSWLGYHAEVYAEDLHAPEPHEQFDPEWGFHSYGETSGEWIRFDYSTIETEILARASVTDRTPIQEGAQAALRAFSDSKAEILPTFDALLSSHEDTVLRDLRDRVEKLLPAETAEALVALRMPRNLSSRDSLAVTQGPRVPHHIRFDTWLWQQESSGSRVEELARFARHAITYMQKRYQMSGKSLAKTEGRIFVGHGGSAVWRDLKEFIKDRLKLEPDDFNREEPAGMAATERLADMLDAACFAFLVFTAEDEHADASKHARENVIHELGLFHGRLGFRRAIILLEEGCSEFSNIHGLQQIRFPKGKIMAVSEQMRRVLEREGIL